MIPVLRKLRGLILQRNVTSYLWLFASSFLTRPYVTTQTKCNKISVGVIGIGRHSRNRLIPTLKSNSLTDISFLAARDWKQHLSPNIQAVVIAVPYSIQAQVALFCLHRGHHVFCESPAALTLGEARKLKQAALRRDLGFRVNYQLQFEPELTHVKNLMAHQASWRLVGSFPAFHHLCDLLLKLAPTPIIHVKLIGEDEGVEIEFQDGNFALLSFSENVSGLSLELFDGSQQLLYQLTRASKIGSN